MKRFARQLFALALSVLAIQPVLGQHPSTTVTPDQNEPPTSHIYGARPLIDAKTTALGLPQGNRAKLDLAAPASTSAPVIRGNDAANPVLPPPKAEWVGSHQFPGPRGPHVIGHEPCPPMEECLPPCRAPKQKREFIWGVGFNYLQPFYQNPGNIGALGNVRDIDFDAEGAPYYYMNYSFGNGMGVRVNYYDRYDNTAAVKTSAGSGTYDLDYAYFDGEIFKQWYCPEWNLRVEASGGFRYFDTNQSWVGATTNDPTTIISSTYSYAGIGPTFFVEAAHEISCCYTAFANMRLTGLLGDKNLQSSVNSFEDNSSDAIGVGEFKLGFRGETDLQCWRLWFELAGVGQVYQGANTAYDALRMDAASQEIRSGQGTRYGTFGVQFYVGGKY